jgi:hypothetical protein
MPQSFRDAGMSDYVQINAARNFSGMVQRLFFKCNPFHNPWNSEMAGFRNSFNDLGSFSILGIMPITITFSHLKRSDLGKLSKTKYKTPTE